MNKISMYSFGMISRIYCFMKLPRAKVSYITCHFFKSLCQCTHVYDISVGQDKTGIVHIGHL